MSFLTNARLMLVGFAAAQIVGIAVTPVFTRLYSPEAFGFQSLLVGLSLSLAMLATLRLDLALLLATEDEVGPLLGAIASVSVIVLAAITMVLWEFHGFVASFFPVEAAGWIWLVLPMTMATAAGQVSTALLSRGKRFKTVSIASVVNQFAYASAGLALRGLGAPGLAVAKFVGAVGAAALMAADVSRSASFPRLEMPTRPRIVRLWSRFRQFVLFNTPYSLVSTITRETPIYVFTFSGVSAAAGFYGLARMLMGLPNLLATAALSQVFFREAVELKGDPKLQVLVTNLLNLSARGPAALFAFVAVWGDVLFATVFGADWQTAGVYAMLVAPAAWLSLQTGWPERMFEVMQRQDVSFRLQIAFDSVTAAAVILPLALGLDPLYAVAGFAVANSAYHLGYLIAIVRVSSFDYRLLQRVIFQGICIFAAVSVISVLMRAAWESSIWGAVACGIMATSFAAISAWKDFRKTSSRGLSEAVT